MRPPGAVDFTRGPNLDRALCWASSSGGAGWWVELLKSVSAGTISLTTILDRRVAWTPRSLKTSLPTVVLIADDKGDSRDPAEWRCAISAIAWARSAIIHGTGAQAWHYREAVKGALATGRCLLVETDSAHAPAWVDAVLPRGVPALTIIPPPGGMHPVDVGRGAA